MKLFTAEQIRAWDAYTIAHEPIRSVDLMNRAATVLANWFVHLFPDSNQSVVVVVGTGNNGGDGLALARILHYRFYDVKVLHCAFGTKHSEDFDIQMKTLPPRGDLPVIHLKSDADLPTIAPQAILVDGIFGSGLNRPLSGAYGELVRRLNQLPNPKVAIDIPSGLFADDITDGPIFRADYTLSFQIPKRAFLVPENAEFVGQWAFESIGLHPEFAKNEPCNYRLITKKSIRSLMHARPKFGHKGTFGHALLLAGGYGKMGAAVLAAQACLRSGTGLLTVHAPRVGNLVLQTAVPEAMFSPDQRARMWTSLPSDLQPYSSIGVGCGVGTADPTARALLRLLQATDKPLILDADALNLLAAHSDWWRHVPVNSILTPHPKEFERLFGKSTTSFERLNLLQTEAERHGVFILLKGAHTAVACPDGTLWFNTTGNPGMATGGSGDVLTGILTGLLAQGYAPADAVRIGVYVHGLAGDLAAASLGMHAMIASDLIRFLGPAFKSLE
jgi:NAD(P)H-hydrate epimerase